MTMLLRLAALPFRLLAGTVTRTASTAVGSFRVGYRTGRLVGYGRILLVAAGVAVGVLVAPGPGAELRSRIARLVSQRRGAGERGPLVPPSAAPGEAPSPSTPGAAEASGPAAASAPEDVRPPTGPDAVEGAVGVPPASVPEDDDTGELPRPTFE